MYRAVQLYSFLELCEDSSLVKEVLECGAGVHPSMEPLLLRFHHLGYGCHGIEIDTERLGATRRFFEERGLEADLRSGDMRRLPFDDGSMSFVYSWNSIFHMTKQDVGQSVSEIVRVLRPEGLCFVNFLSVESESFGTGREVSPGEYLEMEGGEEVIHSYYEDGEPDQYFRGLEILHREKRVVERLWDGRLHKRAWIDYVAKKTAR
jgi:ubiquinone/menaquinone biosynthesis C-methylase UbiE